MTGKAPAATRFLASVRSAGEAAIALGGGADIIDAKEPEDGALGAVPLPELAAILREVGGRRPVSATIGDCPLEEAADRAAERAALGVDYVKIGFFAEAPENALAGLHDLAAGGTRLIAVLFADRAPQWNLIPSLACLGFAGVMLDTATKGEGGLRTHLSQGDLVRFLSEARSHGLLAGLAGSLGAQDVPALLPLRPDVLGFRGALCAGASRTQRLDGQRVRAIRALIPQEPGRNEQANGRLAMAEEG
jgi:uncharacterized protein (UPF0264 family)